MKAFCFHCKYSEIVYQDTLGRCSVRLYQCDYPENKTDNFWLPLGGRSKPPEELNKNNDCPWYEKAQ